MSKTQKLFTELSTKGIDFAASTYAFLEQQGKDVSSINISNIIDKNQLPIFEQKLQHYRSIYKTQCKIK
jgi:hypothetical protein